MGDDERVVARHCRAVERFDEGPPTPDRACGFPDLGATDARHARDDDSAVLAALNRLAVPCLADEVALVGEGDPPPDVSDGGRTLALPMRAHGAPVGVLTLARGPSRAPFGAADVAIARGVAELAALALDDARRYAVELEAGRGRDEVLAAVAHDLRNPLNTILLCARLLSRSASGGELDAIRVAAARADRLVQDLVAASALDHGRLPLARAFEAPLPMLEEVAALHRPLAAAGAVTIEVAGDGALPRVSVDRHRVVQALSNLVANAIRYAPARSTVSLRARRAARGVELDVVDQGPGIPALQLPRVFERFWRAAGAEDGGVGLGLAIARGIAEAHGGSLGVASEPGEGATFTLVLPVD